MGAQSQLSAATWRTPRWRKRCSVRPSSPRKSGTSLGSWVSIPTTTSDPGTLTSSRRTRTGRTPSIRRTFRPRPGCRLVCVSTCLSLWQVVEGGSRKTHGRACPVRAVVGVLLRFADGALVMDDASRANLPREAARLDGFAGDPLPHARGPADGHEPRPRDARLGGGPGALHHPRRLSLGHVGRASWGSLGAQRKQFCTNTPPTASVDAVRRVTRRHCVVEPLRALYPSCILGGSLFDPCTCPGCACARRPPAAILAPVPLPLVRAQLFLLADSLHPRGVQKRRSASLMASHFRGG